MIFQIIFVVWLIIAIIYTILWVIRFISNKRVSVRSFFISLLIIWGLAPFLLIYDVVFFIEVIRNRHILDRRLTEREKNENNIWEDQREAMFNAWEREQEKNEK